MSNVKKTEKKVLWPNLNHNQRTSIEGLEKNMNSDEQKLLECDFFKIMPGVWKLITVTIKSERLKAKLRELNRDISLNGLIKYIIHVCILSNIRCQQILKPYAKFHNCGIKTEHKSPPLHLLYHLNMKTGDEGPSDNVSCKTKQWTASA
jgi:hypothetical protein